MQVSQEAWGFSDKNIKKIDNNTIHILYKNNIEIINNYLLWKIDVVETPKPVLDRHIFESEEDPFGYRQDIYERERRSWIQDM